MKFRPLLHCSSTGHVDSRWSISQKEATRYIQIALNDLNHPDHVRMLQSVFEAADLIQNLAEHLNLTIWLEISEAGHPIFV